MEILKIVLTILFVIDCIALTIIVLLQEGKSAGLGTIAGGADTYWGQNKGRRTCKVYKVFGNFIFSSCSSIELESICIIENGNRLMMEHSIFRNRVFLCILY